MKPTWRRTPKFWRSGSQRVMDGHPPAPLEAWMEQLYHQVSDQQTMGQRRR